MAYRRAEVGNVDDDRYCWTKCIGPHIGAKPIRDVSPDDIENIRDALTAAVLAYEAAGSVKGRRQDRAQDSTEHLDRADHAVQVREHAKGTTRAARA